MAFPFISIEPPDRNENNSSAPGLRASTLFFVFLLSFAGPLPGDFFANDRNWTGRPWREPAQAPQALSSSSSWPQTPVAWAGSAATASGQPVPAPGARGSRILALGTKRKNIFSEDRSGANKRNRKEKSAGSLLENNLSLLPLLYFSSFYSAGIPLYNRKTEQRPSRKKNNEQRPTVLTNAYNPEDEDRELYPRQQLEYRKKEKQTGAETNNSLSSSIDYMLHCL